MDEPTEPAATPAPAEPAASYYDVGSWGGRLLYQCRRCPVDSLDQTVIEMHVMREHPELFPAPAPKAEPEGEPSAPIPAESSQQEA